MKPYSLKIYGVMSFFLLMSLVLSSCTIVKIVDVGASSAIGLTVGAVKTTGKVIGAVIPDGDEKDSEAE